MGDWDLGFARSGIGCCASQQNDDNNGVEKRADMGMLATCGQFDLTKTAIVFDAMCAQREGSVCTYEKPMLKHEIRP